MKNWFLSFRGKPLSSEIKKIIVSVTQYFDRKKLAPTEPRVKCTEDALGIGSDPICISPRCQNGLLFFKALHYYPG